VSVSQRCTICKIHVDYSNILRKLCVFGFTISSFFDEFVSTEVVVVESSIADTVKPIFKWWKQTQKVICFQQAHTIMMVSSYQNQEASKQHIWKNGCLLEWNRGSILCHVMFADAMYLDGIYGCKDYYFTKSIHYISFIFNYSS